MTNVVLINNNSMSSSFLEYMTPWQLIYKQCLMSFHGILGILDGKQDYKNHIYGIDNDEKC